MEISNLLNEEFKVMVIKILTKLGEKNGWTQEVLQQRDGKYNKVSSRRHRAEEYTKWIQQQTRQSRRKDQFEGKAVELTQLEQQKEKEMKKEKIVYGNYGATSNRLPFTTQGSQKEKRTKKGQKTYVKKQWLKILLTWRRKQTVISRKSSEFQIRGSQGNSH